MTPTAAPVEPFQPSTVELPPLEKLSISVPRPPPLAEEDLVERLFELARPHARERALGPREAVALGDEVVVDVIGYARGCVIPGSVEEDLMLRLEPGELPPVLVDTLGSMTVGTWREVPLALPADYPVASLRGQPALFRVDLKAAYEVRMPDLKSPRLLKKLGRGKTLDETLGAIAQELVEELRQELKAMVEQRAVEQLVARARVEIPEEELEAGLRREWEEGEGAMLARRRLPLDVRERARAAWLREPERRAELLNTLRTGRVLEAVVARERLTLSPERWRQALVEFAGGLGTPVSELQASFEAEPATRVLFERAALFQVAIEHVAAHAQVHLEDGA